MKKKGVNEGKKQENKNMNGAKNLCIAKENLRSYPTRWWISLAAIIVKSHNQLLFPPNAQRKGSQLLFLFSW